jgi:hypothetical protein
MLATARRGMHVAARAACAPGAHAFERSLDDPRGAQEASLARILRQVRGTDLGARFRLSSTGSPATLRERVPETTYDDYARLIERQRAGLARVLTAEECARYQPTSGSSSKVKWIPYTPSFLAELDAAISPWMDDLYRGVPGVRGGRHYWSMSWIPSHLRSTATENLNDDRALLSLSKRLFSILASPVPNDVAYAETSEDSVFATLCFLCAAHDLSVLSVWSPTFALNLFEALGREREAIAATLDAGAWSESRPALPSKAPRSLRAAQLLRAWDGALEPAFFAELWPELAFVSAWDTSTSKRWAERLGALLPQATFQGKGLWATEGVVTFPYRGRYPLAVRSHFYEFVDLESERPHFAWELREGQVVRPLLTTSSGLLRYGLRDRLVVSGHLGRTPCFEFLGRIGDVDMVGEKTSPEAAQLALDALARGDRCRPLSLLALAPPSEGERPRYVALCEGPASREEDERRSALLEQTLHGAFHYALARDLGQLAPARVLTAPDALALYEAVGTARGMVSGNIKVEPLLLCADAESAGLVAARLQGARARDVEPSSHRASPLTQDTERRT